MPFKKLELLPVLALLALSAAALEAPAAAQRPAVTPSITYNFRGVTQGPLWPPAIATDENGDYLVVGIVLTEVAPGVVVPVPNQAALVSKDTQPPLGPDGREDFSNPFGAPYQVIRPLDLSPGSPDLDIVLYANSFGPPEGDFGGGPRMPRLGDGPWNHNQAEPGQESCPEQFPSLSQRPGYTRPRYPFHEVPIFGFRGDGVRYDPDTGEAIPAQESPIDSRRREPVTLGQYLAGERRVTITLTRWNEQVQAFTAARFDVELKGLLPDSVYHVSLLRTQIFDPRPVPGNPTSLTASNLVITDDRGNGRIVREIPNPFPDPAVDDAGLRVVGIVGAYHSDHQGWAGCPGRIGSSVDTHAFFNSFTEGIQDLTDFVTREAP
jgi:hypothetical protein